MNHETSFLHIFRFTLNLSQHVDKTFQMSSCSWCAV